MGLFLVLLCCSAVVGGCGGLVIFPDNSRFGEFNSRLGIANSRFALLGEFAGKALIHLTVFAAKPWFSVADRRNSRLRRDKPGIGPDRRISRARASMS
jgi:hypothetical protein